MPKLDNGSKASQEAGNIGHAKLLKIRIPGSFISLCRAAGLTALSEAAAALLAGAGHAEGAAAGLALGLGADEAAAALVPGVAAAGAAGGGLAGGHTAAAAQPGSQPGQAAQDTPHVSRMHWVAISSLPCGQEKSGEHCVECGQQEGRDCTGPTLHYCSNTLSW